MCTVSIFNESVCLYNNTRRHPPTIPFLDQRVRLPSEPDWTGCIYQVGACWNHTDSDRALALPLPKGSACNLTRYFNQPPDVCGVVTRRMHRSKDPKCGQLLWRTTYLPPTPFYPPDNIPQPNRFCPSVSFLWIPASRYGRHMP